jgi:protein-L-isoaspartate(D-aspartate) O-methyltransferase
MNNEPSKDNIRMIREQIEARGVKNERILDAMRHVDRALFVPDEHLEDAYEDKPLPLADLATISQPYIVALMTELLDPQPGDRVLEVGCGSGYQAAILSRLCSHVYSLELKADLADIARFNLRRYGAQNVTIIVRDGWIGLANEAPFDKIIVTAAPDCVPEPLQQQLAVGGRMTIPVGPQEDKQDLLVVEKPDADRTITNCVTSVRFVPLRHDDLGV